MGKGALLAGSLALGVAGGLLGSVLVPSSPSPAASDPALATPIADRSDLERLERRVNALSATVNAPALAPASTALAAAPTGNEGGGSSSAPAVPASTDRLEALEKRVAALESRGSGGTPVPADLSKLPVVQLEALVRNLTAERRSADAIPVAEELLRRNDLTPEQRVDTEMSIGYGLRSQGKNAEAEARFRETLARVGDDSEKAPWLGFQIAWERSYQKDLQGAVAEMERAANHARVQPIVRAHALYNAASFARQAGDNARAQVFLERLLTQHPDDLPPSQANMKAQAEAWLKEIRGN
jgi:tetratricopeptide (TPR) repeat protein